MRYTQTPTPSVTATPTLTASYTPSNTPTGTACPGFTPTATSSQTPTPTPTRTLSITPTVTPTKTATPTPTPTEVCKCYGYTVTNNSMIDMTRVDWTGCDGYPDSQNLPPLNGISFCACKSSVTTLGGDPVVVEGTPCITYTWFGTTSTYESSDLACFNRNCTRPYYTITPVMGAGQVIYNDPSLTIPFNGGNLWIAVNLNCAGGWYIVQVDATGNVINTASPCP